MNNISSANQPKVKCIINNQEILATIDSGAPVSIISKSLADKLALNYEKNTNVSDNLQGVSGTKLHVSGIAETEIIIKNEKFSEKFIVISNVHKNTILLGLEFLKKQNFVLDFSVNELKASTNTAKEPILNSKIYVNGSYRVRPFSTEIIFGKINLNSEINNLLTCNKLDLVISEQIGENVIFEAINLSNNTIPLYNEDILAISYNIDNQKIIKNVVVPKTDIDRAKSVYNTLNISANHLFSDNQKKKLWNIILSNNRVFAIEENDVGFILNYKHKIVLKNEQELIKGNKTYPVPLKLLDPAKKELERLERLKIIERKSTKYAIPSFFIKKHNDINKVRLLNDFRYLNSLITPELACIASSEILLTSISHSKATIFATIDLKDGFYSIQLDEASRDYCSFTIPNIGSYRYLKLPLGLASSPAAMGFVIQKLLGSEIGVLNYMDDLLLYAKNADELIETISRVLHKLNENGFKVNYSKMQIGNTIKFLGFSISASGIKPIEEKVAAIKALPPPSTRRGCQAVVGSLSYYRRYIQSYSKISKPLTDCLRQKMENGKVSPFKLTPEAKQAFERLKLELTRAPILKYPDKDKKFYVFCDSSQYSCGSALMQLYGETFFPISFFSKSLTSGQSNYPAFLRELLAIIYSIKHFNFYLEGAVFEVHTDSQTLCKPKFLKDAN